MREILFRGKRVDNGEWVEGGLISIDLETCSEVEKKKYTHCIVEPNIEFYRGQISCFEFVLPETVGQYTGLNVGGDKLFEGHIVEYNEEYGEIVYNKETARFMVEFDTWCIDFDHLNPNELEIVGNIHDNPELLKGGVDNGSTKKM